VVVLAVLLWAAPAAAQVPVGDRPAFSVERFTPPPGHASFGTVEEPDVLPRWQWSASLWSSFMSRPIVFRDILTGEEATVPVRWRLGFDASGAIGLGKRFQVGVAVPWAVQDGDRLQGTGIDAAPLDRFVLGDMRVHARVRIAGAPGDRGLGSALAGTWHLPTGDDDDFAGELNTMYEWKLAVGWRGARWAAAGNLGLRVRNKEVVLLSPARPHGNELLTGAAATVALPGVPRLGVPRSWAIGEVVWAIGDAPTGTRGPSPGELRAGLRAVGGGGWSLTALFGVGLTPGDVGSPSWRAVLGLTHDRAPVDDADRDGIIDARDRCRTDREDRDDVDDDDGCPDPDDDGDGILDVADRCPLAAEDDDDYQDSDGCPDSETHITPAPPSDFGAPPLTEWLSDHLHDPR
jgi:hypothetical protein